jgi:hypothetical protein
MLELIIVLSDLLRRDYSENWIKSPINEFPQSCQSFTLSPGERAGVRASVNLIEYIIELRRGLTRNN